MKIMKSSIKSRLDKLGESMESNEDDALRYVFRLWNLEAPKRKLAEISSIHVMRGREFIRQIKADSEEWKKLIKEKGLEGTSTSKLISVVVKGEKDA
jgi:hypothetical protein